ncbi:hypothetical protein B842_04930 [Corynebacterium humireducens NBRC 106098 = DSM 45392]|uniref:Solute-binding protein family 5 domain-containing protein n=1 Tax=Corynebacterium humireducens NBRC 106098 = DSM 45392 TaxID=1223515 RepID=A0A0B5D6N3_9CORY|nr:ABC transporter family substrate-binding protein [Corynebacterium humireducens]AJE32837.1 hypothetical protein B842_04930 [Corynebacterium humireducens NBRC 106098 = DSM 45392]
MKARLLPALLLTLAVSLTACAANPGPPPVEDPEPVTSTSAVEPTQTTTPVSRADKVITVGVDPLPAGFHPHLLAHESHLTRSLAQLVLPSAFHGGAMNADLLESASQVEPVPGVAQTISYVISPAAQWSDGTPITGADFRYLWQGMTNTPGVSNPAGYQAISEIRTSADGRTVDVDLHTFVSDWRSLFNHLVPSHLLQNDVSRFATALSDGIPASGGRYMVRAVDRARGIVTLHRNDRFWGADPAETDRVIFREVRGVTQGVEQLRSGQIDFLDTIPTETSVDSYRLMRDTQVRLVDQPRELTLTLSTTSALLAEQPVRAELHSLLDVPLIARLAAGRSAELPVPGHLDARGLDEGAPALLPGLTGEEGRPLRIGVDPTDDSALSAARTIVDLLSHFEVRAEMVTADLRALTAEHLPAGDDGGVDAVIAWQHTGGASLGLAGRWLCPPAPDSPRAGNLSGYCAEDTQTMAEALITGEATVAEGEAFFAAVNDREHVVVPLLGERRVLVLGAGIVGPDPDLENWTAGISTVASWRKQ